MQIGSTSHDYLNDPFGNVSNVGGATTVSLSSNPPGAAFFSGPSCASGVPSVTIAAGTNSANLYFSYTVYHDFNRALTLI